MKRKTPLRAKTPLKRRQKPLRRTKPLRTRKSTKAAKIRRRKGIWSTKTADSYFSKYIRERDGKCLRCGTTENLTCSHYFRRGISATRYDPKNNITLCAECHAEWEGPKKEYTQLMRNLLGDEEFLALTEKAGETIKRTDAVAEFKSWYESYPQK